MRRDENDPFITGLDNMKIATTFPTTPKMDTADNKTPSMIKVNIVLLRNFSCSPNFCFYFSEPT